jgi:hypothetical protein
VSCLRLPQVLTAALGTLLLAAAPAPAQTQAAISDPAHQLYNARLDVRAAATTLSREIEAVAASGETGWIAYRLPMAPGAKQMCRSWSPDGAPQILLEAPSEMTVLVRVEARQVVRVQTATPECAVDAGGLPVLWLTGVAVTDSVDWLNATIRAVPPVQRGPSRLLEPSLAALAGHPGDPATRSLVTFAREDSRAHVRGRALFWLGQRAGREATAAIDDAISQDPDTEVKKTAVAALGRLPPDQGVPLLIDVARTHGSPQIRRQAMFWLGQSRDPRAVTFFEEVLTGSRR